VSILKGVYVLIIQISNDIDVTVGALGRRALEKGLYTYVGSAQNNLEQRIKRHLRREKRLFWHIDCLLGNDAAKILEVLYRQADKTLECTIAEEIRERGGEPIDGFGCSDCDCNSHLLRVTDYRFLRETMQVLYEKT
jgi:Uri superfamily endonuclease